MKVGVEVFFTSQAVLLTEKNLSLERGGQSSM